MLSIMHRRQKGQVSKKTKRVKKDKRGEQSEVQKFEPQQPEPSPVRQYEEAGPSPRQCYGTITLPSGSSTTEYEIKYEDLMNGRYNIIDTLGEGSFGQVVLAYDFLCREHVAIKLIDLKGGKVLHESLHEIEFLELIWSETNAASNNGIVKLNEYFAFDGHLCLVFELLSMNLQEALDEGNNLGLPFDITLHIAEQLLSTLNFLKRINIIHCDLKPDNIMLCRPKRSVIKIADFGCSCLHGKQMYTYITTRYYRAPEIMLGLSYDYAIDMWSAGCILFEILIGVPLFRGSSEFDQMMRIVEVLGMPPADMLDKAPCTHRFFAKQPDGSYVPKESAEGIMYGAPGSKPLEFIFELVFGPAHEGETFSESFISLLMKMLQFDALQRVSPAAALQHPIFAESAGEDWTTAEIAGEDWTTAETAGEDWTTAETAGEDWTTAETAGEDWTTAETAGEDWFTAETAGKGCAAVVTMDNPVPDVVEEEEATAYQVFFGRRQDLPSPADTVASPAPQDSLILLEDETSNGGADESIDDICLAFQRLCM